MSSKVSRRRALAACGAIALTPLVGCTMQPVTSFAGATMGTRYQVRMRSNGALQAKLPSLQKTAATVLAELERELSTYQPQSDVARFNRANLNDWVAVGATTAHITKTALQVSALSRSAFDPTVGPLVALWGFGPDGRGKQLPSPSHVSDVLATVGTSNIEQDGEMLRKRHLGVGIDLNGIAKGYAVDALAQLLERYGINDYLVDIGGELRARGTRDGTQPWRVGILDPLTAEASAMLALDLRDQAIATSGNYFNYFVANGRRYSHNIDPRTGTPIRHRTVSVTVIAKDAMEADAWSTALMTLGRQQGAALAAQLELAALFLDHDGSGGSTRFATPALRFSHPGLAAS